LELTVSPEGIAYDTSEEATDQSAFKFSLYAVVIIDHYLFALSFGEGGEMSRKPLAYFCFGLLEGNLNF
jgi:hypothetical protein